jgi:hypothetical protein
MGTQQQRAIRSATATPRAGVSYGRNRIHRAAATPGSGIAARNTEAAESPSPHAAKVCVAAINQAVLAATATTATAPARRHDRRRADHVIPAVVAPLIARKLSKTSMTTSLNPIAA